MATYNGHPSYNAWNVALWIANDEGLYALAKEIMQEESSLPAAALRFIVVLSEGCNEPCTPDGVPYTKTNVIRAMRGLRS